MSSFLAVREEGGEMGESLTCCACGGRRDGSVPSFLCVWREERWVSPFLPLRVERGEMGESLPCTAC